MIDRDTIIKLAREAGGVPAGGGTFIAGTIDWERFAALVAEHEREACAKVVENMYYGLRIQPSRSQCADAIRSRKSNA